MFQEITRIFDYGLSLYTSLDYIDIDAMYSKYSYPKSHTSISSNTNYLLLLNVTYVYNTTIIIIARSTSSRNDLLDKT
jgi:hypothetical protein